MQIVEHYISVHFSAANPEVISVAPSSPFFQSLLTRVALHQVTDNAPHASISHASSRTLSR
jgi:hypothetical protein